MTLIGCGVGAFVTTNIDDNSDVKTLIAMIAGTVIGALSAWLIQRRLQRPRSIDHPLTETLPIKTYFYSTGEAVRLGDQVFTGNRKHGVVIEIFQPGTEAAREHACHDTGGILISEQWSDGVNLVLETPPDREFWEDLEFIARADESASQ